MADTPRPGDFVVVYPDAAAPAARLELVRLEPDGNRFLVRATFANALDAAARFEHIARAMAACAGTRAFRCVGSADLTEITGEAHGARPARETEPRERRSP